MSGRVTASPPAYSVCSTARRTPSIIHRPRFLVHSRASRDQSSFPLTLNHFSSRLQKFPRNSFRCSSTGDSGENESKTILDAFFLGKAVAEALNERIESSVGEFLSIIGRLQAEQQKQVQEFQEDVLEKARRAKEQAAREAMGLVPKSSTVEISRVNGVASNSSSATDAVNSVVSQSKLLDIEDDPTNEG
ncbi:hypothetical protein ACS0TY_002903 [Phlomoides rotata]